VRSVGELQDCSLIRVIWDQKWAQQLSSVLGILHKGAIHPFNDVADAHAVLRASAHAFEATRHTDVIEVRVLHEGDAQSLIGSEVWNQYGRRKLLYASGGHDLVDPVTGHDPPGAHGGPPPADLLPCLAIRARARLGSRAETASVGGFPCICTRCEEGEGRT